MAICVPATLSSVDRKSTRLNSSHTVIYTLSLHDALPISLKRFKDEVKEVQSGQECGMAFENYGDMRPGDVIECRSEEHTSELQSHSDLHSFPTRRSSDLTEALQG